MREIWECDRCGAKFKLVPLVEGESKRYRIPSEMKDHNAVHEAQGETFGWVVYTETMQLAPAD